MGKDKNNEGILQKALVRRSVSSFSSAKRLSLRRVGRKAYRQKIGMYHQPFHIIFAPFDEVQLSTVNYQLSTASIAYADYQFASSV